MKGGLLVIDNGTWECRAGTAESPSVRVRNQIYRFKGKDGKTTYSFSPNKGSHGSSTIKSMFDGSVVYNYEVFEGSIEAILSETGAKQKDLIITECFLNPQVFKDLALESVFERFSFGSVQFGYDFIYSYGYNMKNNRELSVAEDGFKRDFCDVVISMGHLGVYIVPVDPVRKCILYEESAYMPLGGLAAQHIFYRTVANKYYGTGIKIAKEDVEEYFKNIRVPLDYLEEIEDVVHDGVGNMRVTLKSVKEKAAAPKSFIRKKPVSEGKKKVKVEIETEEIEKTTEPEDTPVDAEEFTELLEAPEEEIKPELTSEEELARRLKREKLIKGATEHRNKQKIAKLLERLNYHILLLEDRHLLKNNPGEFMNIRKERMEYLERVIKKRTFVRNELKNRKSVHSLALLKKSLAAPDTVVEDNLYLQEVGDAALEDTEILDEIEYIDMFLKENDPTYTSKEENPLDKIRFGYKEKGGVNINVEFIRTAEALFSPSIVGIEQPGLLETLSAVFSSKDVRNIFITGGFSQIKGMKERIQKDIVPLRYFSNEPRVVCALDPVNDAYKGAFLKSEYFKTYTRKDYLAEGTKKEK